MGRLESPCGVWRVMAIERQQTCEKPRAAEHDRWSIVALLKCRTDGAMEKEHLLVSTKFHRSRRKPRLYTNAPSARVPCPGSLRTRCLFLKKIIHCQLLSPARAA